ncbi:MAG: nucleotidyltransferase domain-containing protein [Candidatus Scalindua sediminis]|nr:nucleotidyltransferase domain-containing protein [Candidatus Scalindua sediminis]
MCNKELKEKIIEYFQDKKGVIAVYLYGSIVTGKNVMDSDVDIALLTAPYKDSVQSQRAKVRYQTEISGLIRRDIDLVFLQEAGELLSFQILKRGQVIFERDREVHRSFRAFRLIQCLDFQFLENRMQRGMIAAMKGGIIGQ